MYMSANVTSFSLTLIKTDIRINRLKNNSMAKWFSIADFKITWPLPVGV